MKAIFAVGALIAVVALTWAEPSLAKRAIVVEEATGVEQPEAGAAAKAREAKEANEVNWWLIGLGAAAVVGVAGFWAEDESQTPSGG